MKHVEGVPYYRHVVRFTLSDGWRLRRVRYSPGHPWIYTEVARWLDVTFGIENIKPRSVTIRLAELS